jgi:hypothetical protein
MSALTQARLRLPFIGDTANHIASTENPHTVTAAQVGLGNVDNESKATMFSDPTFTGTVSIPDYSDIKSTLDSIHSIFDLTDPASTVDHGYSDPLRSLRYVENGTDYYFIGWIDSIDLTRFKVSTQYVFDATDKTQKSYASLTYSESLYISDDGSTVTFGGDYNTDYSVRQAELSTPYDVTTMGTAYYLYGQPALLPESVTGIEWSSDGNYLFGLTNSHLYRWTFAIPFDIRSCTSSSQTNYAFTGSYSTGDLVMISPTSFVFTSTNKLYALLLKTNYDLSSVYYESQISNAHSSITLIKSTCYIPSQKILYLSGNGNTNVYRYNFDLTINFFYNTNSLINRLDSMFTDLSTSLAHEYYIGDSSTAIKSNISAGGGNSRGLFVVGDYIFTVGGSESNGRVRKYDKSSGMMSLTLEENVEFSIGTYSQGIHFNDDGTKMFAGMNPSIKEFDLSTAYDLSTATDSGNSYTHGFASNVCGLRFSGDGTKFYLMHHTDGSYQYSCDEFSLTNVSSEGLKIPKITSFNGYSLTPRGCCFSHEGKTFYVQSQMGTINETHIAVYELETPYDLSVHSLRYEVHCCDIYPNGIHIVNESDPVVYISDADGYMHKINANIYRLPKQNFDVIHQLNDLESRIAALE